MQVVRPNTEAPPKIKLWKQKDVVADLGTYRKNKRGTGH